MTREAAIAVNRFGLGARPGELEAAARDPRGWLHTQLDAVPPPPEALAAAAPDAAAALETTFLQQRTQPDPNPVAQAHRDGSNALLAHWVTTPAPFLERWAWFWTNHLAVSVRGGNTGALVADYHLRAIRPHALGRFEDMLLASARHPAMLRYLDNAQSFGPNSQAGLRARRGLNENYARELLELHTLSPAGGYSQADVTELARLLTGWSSGTPGPAPFVFRAAAHEPGPKTVLGASYGEGEAEGVRAIRVLATHPATWRHLATKLARHFVADDPPAAAVAAIEARLAATGGDLKQAALAVIDLPEAWARAQAKLRPPLEYLVAVLRATGDPLPATNLLGAAFTLGQAPFVAPAPNGWPDRAEAWAAPEAVMRRVEWAGTIVRRIADPPDPRLLLDATLGPLADRETRFHVANAESARDGLLVLLGAPAFQRR